WIAQLRRRLPAVFDRPEATQQHPPRQSRAVSGPVTWPCSPSVSCHSAWLYAEGADSEILESRLGAFAGERCLHLYITHATLQFCRREIVCNVFRRGVAHAVHDRIEVFWRTLLHHQSFLGDSRRQPRTAALGFHHIEHFDRLAVRTLLDDL